MDGKELGELHAMPVATVDGYTQYGLTLRQHFAGLAMQGYLANPTLHDKKTLESIVSAAGRDTMTPCEIVAMLATDQADALLAELAKDQP